MKRRTFLGRVAAGAGLAGGVASSAHALTPGEQAFFSGAERRDADVIIAGGGLGGCAAALAALHNNLTVVMTEETDWIGGQLSQQAVPPDEHRWIETHGAPQRYRDFRAALRTYYKQHYPLTAAAKEAENLNPGNGSVSRLCHEPRVAVAVLEGMFAPFISNGRFRLLLQHVPVKAVVSGNKVRSLTVKHTPTGVVSELAAPYFIDATELGDLLPLTGTEFVTGAESKAETGELHAAAAAMPANHQAFTMVFAMDHVAGADHVIEKPKEYDFWRNFHPEMDAPWSGRLLDLRYSNPKTLEPKALGFHPEGIATGDALNLWNYRRIIDRRNFLPGVYDGDITIVNWPQNDYFLGNLVGVSDKEFRLHVARAKQLSLSLLYWLQTEVPRPDGGKGWPGLRLRGDITGTLDGLAKYPYVRESRRIRAMFTIREEHVGAEQRALVTGQPQDRAAEFYDSVGVGYYHIDLHPSSGGNNYIDFPSLPFQIPLGALIPRRMENLLPANKNIGTTHVTNGCYRLHPVEWSIGEAVGLLVKFALEKDATPAAVRAHTPHLEEFQAFVRSQGVETSWPAL